MSEKIFDRPKNKPTEYRELITEAKALTENESDALANLANLASLLFNRLDDLNWTGFYLMRGSELVLGPFMGKPACIRIPLEQGVCGTAAATATTQRVSDVDLFSGHITCDADSRSEIVVPVIREGRVLAVLDIDSPTPNRFDQQDQQALEELAQWLSQQIDFQQFLYR